MPCAPRTLAGADGIAGERGRAGRSSAPQPLPPGTAVRIKTGALVPPGADLVVQVEWTDGGTEVVTVRRSPPPGSNIRRRVQVHPRPRVADPRVADLVLLARALAADNTAALAACARIDKSQRPRGYGA